MKLKTLLFSVLLSLSTTVQAQVYTWDCVTRSCTFVTDPWPLTGIQPTACRFYANGTVMNETPPQTLPTGERYCLWTMVIGAGNYTFWATAMANGFESSRSNMIQASIQGGMMQAPEAPQVLRRISQ